MSEYKLFAQRVGLVGIVNLLVSLSGLILLPILTKTLPIEEYGIWVQILVTITLISPIVGLGLPYTMVRFLAAEKDKTKIQEGFYSVAVFISFTSLAASVLLMIYSEPFATAFLGGRADLMRVISVIIPIECLAFTKDINKTIEGADAIVIVTRHKEYLNLDLSLVINQMRTSVLVDGRNAYNKEECENLGFIYKGIGKPH